jgi:hypothetical protein
VLADALRDID